MRRTLPAAALAAFALAACQDATVAPTAYDSELSMSRAPVYIVVFKPGVDVDATTDQLAEETGMTVTAR